MAERYPSIAAPESHHGLVLEASSPGNRLEKGASQRTPGFDLLDSWCDPSRRLAHDRIAHTVVARRAGDV